MKAYRIQSIINFLLLCINTLYPITQMVHIHQYSTCEPKGSTTHRRGLSTLFHGDLQPAPNFRMDTVGLKWVLTAE